MSHLAETADTVLEGFILSPQQLRLWHWRRRLPPAATAVLRLGLPADVDPARLRHSLDALVRRHEILRTGYRRLPGMAHPVQVVLPPGPVAWNAETAADRPAATIKAAPPGLSLTLRLPGGLLDTASLCRLAGQWARLYGGDSLGEDPLQYADYAAWRSELPDSDPQARHFWSRQAAMQSPAVGLPLRRSAPAADAIVEPARLACPLSPDLAADCIQRAAALGCPPALLVMAAWLTLWHRHSEADRLTLGMDWSSDAALQAALGLFSEPLPLTADGLDRQRFAGLVQSLDQRRAALLEWRDYFPSQTWTEPPLLGFRHVETAQPALAALGWRLEEAYSPTLPCPLLLEVQNHSGGLTLVLHHDPGCYLAADAGLLAEQLLSLLADACRNPGSDLAALSACSAEEQRRWHREFSRSAPLTAAQEAAYAAIAGLPSLAACVERQARLHGDRPAVQGVGVLSYRELDDQAARLARQLLARGAAGGRIVHFLPRDNDAIVALLAILKAGGCYVPVDPDYPAGRIEYLLEDAGAHVVITCRALAARLPAAWQWSERLLLVDAPPPVVDSGQPRPAVSPDQWAWLIYTSGSTGAPKGVPITQAGALHSLAARAAWYPEPVDRFLLLSSLAFDSAIAGIFWTLAQGGCLHLCSEAQQKDPAQLAGLINTHGVSHLLALPSLYELLLESLGDAAPALRTVIVAGEACPRALVENHARRRPWTRLYNEYGPTEAAVWSTVAECRPAADPQAPVPIGRPIPHSRVYLLDDQGRPVARGLKGEIYIAGPGLSPGYLGRPALTAARFAPAPAPLDMDGRLYRSGDLAYLDGRGELVFLGRCDDQVKLRGYRIEPGEIEALLREQPGVAQAVVLADTEGGPRLRAFVESATALDPAALTRALARRLPAYMIPDDLHVLPALPRSANGKIDRRALLALQPRQRRAPYAAPRSHAEKVLAALWGQLLGIDHVGRDDDFFALGGHSLLVAQLVHRIKAVLDADMPVGQVFRHRRLHDLAARLERAPEDGGLVILRPGDPSRPPLFCLHESAGDVHPYLALAAALPQEQPVYGLALNDPAADVGLTELAARHLDSLRRRRPGGPYALCGWSIGGVLALEVARSLERAGEGVAFLGIIDAGFDADDAPLPWKALWALYADELTGEGRQRLAALPAGEPARLREALAGRPKLEQVRALLLEHAPRHRLPTRAPQGVIEYRIAAMASARRWLRDYAPPAVAADIHGWWAEETLRRTPGLPERWRQLCGRLHAAGVAGDHDGILQQADFLARFRKALAAQMDGVGRL